MPRTDLRAFLVLLFGAGVVGFAPILVRLADVGPAAAGLWRFVFAAPLMLALVLANRRGAGRPQPMMVWAGLLIAADLAFWHYGIVLTSVANATVLSNMTPVVVTLVTWALTRQAPRRTFLLAMTLAVGGAVVMALARGGGGQGSNPPLGNLFSAVTALFYGGYFLAVGKARETAPALRVMLWSTLAGIPLFLLVAVILREPLLPASAGGWAACAALGAMHLAGQGSIAWALGRLPAPTVSVVVLVQPVVAAALGWLLFAERVTPVQALGAAIALTGVVLAQRGTRAVGAPPAEAAPEAMAAPQRQMR